MTISEGQEDLLRCAQNITRHHKGAGPKKRLIQAVQLVRRRNGLAVICGKVCDCAKVAMLFAPLSEASVYAQDVTSPRRGYDRGITNCDAYLDLR